MISPLGPSRRPRRHDLVFVSQQAWCALLAMRRDLAADPWIALWSSKGWPLIGRRAMPGDPHGVPLGLPLPPYAGKRRVALVMQPNDILSVAPPLALSCITRVAPRSWRPTLCRLGALAARHSVHAGVCGSLAWQALTELNYVTTESDLDVLLHVGGDTQIDNLTTGMARIAAAAPMRIDGELVREDGAAVNWRELHNGTREVLAKTVAGVLLIAPRSFLSGNLLS